jgi:hypothetical protein
VKFQPGQVVYLNSAYVGGAQPCTIVFAHPEEPPVEADIGTKPGKPARYDCAMVQKDGGNLITFTMPEYALRAAEEQ